MAVNSDEKKVPLRALNFVMFEASEAVYTSR